MHYEPLAFPPQLFPVMRELAHGYSDFLVSGFRKVLMRRKGSSSSCPSSARLSPQPENCHLRQPRSSVFAARITPWRASKRTDYFSKEEMAASSTPSTPSSDVYPLPPSPSILPHEPLSRKPLQRRHCSSEGLSRSSLSLGKRPKLSKRFSLDPTLLLLPKERPSKRASVICQMDSEEINPVKVHFYDSTVSGKSSPIDPFSPLRSTTSYFLEFPNNTKTPANLHALQQPSRWLGMPPLKPPPIAADGSSAPSVSSSEKPSLINLHSLSGAQNVDINSFHQLCRERPKSFPESTSPLCQSPSSGWSKPCPPLSPDVTEAYDETESLDDEDSGLASIDWRQFPIIELMSRGDP